MLLFLAVSLCFTSTPAGFRSDPDVAERRGLNRLLELLPPGMRGWTSLFVLSGSWYRLVLSGTGTHRNRLAGRFLISGVQDLSAFWFLIAITVSSSFVGLARSRSGLAAELLFFQELCGGLVPHTWTLAVEGTLLCAARLLFLC